MSKYQIFYKAGYKYQLFEEYEIEIDFLKDIYMDEEFYYITDGWLTIKSGYAWNGASGPVIDTCKTKRASLVHDVLYQMIRNKLIPYDLKELSDNLFQSILIDDEYPEILAKIYKQGLLLFGNISLKNEPSPLLVAP